MNIKLSGSSKVKGTIKTPGDKSISHRAIMLGALASGATSINNYLSSQDCLSTISCFRHMGIQIEKQGRNLSVRGNGLRGLVEPNSVLDCGNSGTTMRVLSGVLAGQKFYSVLTGDKSLSQRPMTRVIDPLSKMGAQIWARSGNLAPLAIKGKKLQGKRYKLEVASAQVKTALMFAGLYADGRTTIIEPTPTRDHTERMMPAFGIEVLVKDQSISVSAPRSLSPATIDVPGDLSSAVFFIAAAALAKQGELLITNVGVNPTRIGALKVFKRMGIDFEIIENKNGASEPVADIIARPSKLRAINVGGKMIPTLIDEIPLLAMLATQAEGTTVIKNAGELRVKESDRIAIMVKNLRAMGADVEELKDGMVIKGPTKLKAAAIETAHDHRIAMTFAVAATVAKGTTEIIDAECASVSFPDFYKRFQAVRS